MKPASTWMALMLAILSSPANAAQVGVRLSDPHQVKSSERVEVGMIVDARTDTLTMTAGGGYTLTCPDTAPLTAQRALQFSRWPAGFAVSVFVPEKIPVAYTHFRLVFLGSALHALLYVFVRGACQGCMGQPVGYRDQHHARW